MIVFGKSGFIRANVVVIGQTGCFLGKMVLFRQSVFLLENSVVFGQIG